MNFLLQFISSASASSSPTTGHKTMGIWERIAPPIDISENGHLIDSLFNYITMMDLFFFILVCIGLFGFSWKYYYRRNRTPYYTYGNKKSHIWIVTTIGIAVFLMVDINIARMSNDDYTDVFINWPKNDDPETFKVEVLGQQWAWHFRLPGRDGEFNTDDDIVMLNDLRVPVGKKVVFQLISKDVIHSLYFPNTRRKVDAIPGRVTRLWFKPIKTGEFDVACAEMCGTYHYRMKAKMIVYSQEEYARWEAEASETALIENDPEDVDRYWGWKWN